MSKVRAQDSSLWSSGGNFLDVLPAPDVTQVALSRAPLRIHQDVVVTHQMLVDPGETWLEKWLLHEASEVYNYWGCLQSEPNPRLRDIWQRFVDYELGHLHFVRELFERIERRDAAEVLPATLPEAIDLAGHRAFVRKVLESEVDLRAVGTQQQTPGLELGHREGVRHAHRASFAAVDRWCPQIGGVHRSAVSTVRASGCS